MTIPFPMKNDNHPHSVKSAPPMLHRGPWIIAAHISQSGKFALRAIENGALVVADGMIHTVGKYDYVAKEFGHLHVQDHEGRILVPALINGHCHLELSHVDPGKSKQAPQNYHGDLTLWIRDLLAERSQFAQDRPDADKLILSQARRTLRNFAAEGVCFVGDVGNSLASRNIGENGRPRVSFLLEILGLTRESEAKSFSRFADITAAGSIDINCTAHAPYSTTPGLIRAIKKQSVNNGKIFSIHVAESEQEIELLQHGTGIFKEFLMERGAWDGSFTIPAAGSVQYLESLGVLDEKTICVHAVHVDQAGIEILAQKKAKVCLCPGSNRYIGVGKPPVTEFLHHGILPALGTDSKASNKSLSMWREMRLLREDHPGLRPETVFTMATRGGAEAWGVSAKIGALAPGKLPLVLRVGSKEKFYSADAVFEFLTTAGESVQAEWLG